MIKRKSILTVTIFLCSIILVSTAFAAPSDGLYVSGRLGHTNFAEIDFVPTDDAEIELKSGAQDVGIAIGYQKGSLRYEGEYLAFLGLEESEKLFNEDIILIGASGKFTTHALMANVYYDFLSKNNTKKRFSFNPYIGAGAGYAHNQRSAELIILNHVVFDESVNSNLFAYQAMVGARVYLSENFSIAPEYRYFGTTTLKNSNDRLSAHSLFLNFNYQFGN